MEIQVSVNGANFVRLNLDIGLIEMARGNKSWIAYGQKKQNGQSDLEQLIDMATYIRKKYKVVVKREPFLLFNCEGKLISNLEKVKKSEIDKSITIKNPDLVWYDKYGMWVIEIDGNVHLNRLSKDEERNRIYIENHIKLIVVPLYEYDMKSFDIYQYVDEKILELIRNKHR